MTDQDPRPRDENAGSDGSGPPEEIPLGQRLLDRPFLLLIACIVVMFVFYTGWGVWEMTSLTEAPLP